VPPGSCPSHLVQHRAGPGITWAGSLLSAVRLRPCPGQLTPGGGVVVGGAVGVGVGLSVVDGDVVGVAVGTGVGEVGAVVGVLDGCPAGSHATPSPSGSSSGR